MYCMHAGVIIQPVTHACTACASCIEHWTALPTKPTETPQVKGRQEVSLMPAPWEADLLPSIPPTPTKDIGNYNNVLHWISTYHWPQGKDLLQTSWWSYSKVEYRSKFDHIVMVINDAYLLIGRLSPAPNTRWSSIAVHSMHVREISINLFMSPHSADSQSQRSLVSKPSRRESLEVIGVLGIASPLFIYAPHVQYVVFFRSLRLSIDVLREFANTALWRLRALSGISHAQVKVTGN